jgi:hypothetical protein
MIFNLLYTFCFWVIPVAVAETIWYSPFVKSHLPASMFVVWPQESACLNLTGACYPWTTHSYIAFSILSAWYLVFAFIYYSQPWRFMTMRPKK